MKRMTLVAIAVVLAASSSLASVAVVRWDKTFSGKRGHVVAFDLSARKVLWEADPCPVASFVEKTSSGFLVGCDNSRILMLDSGTGKTIWDTNATTKADIVTKKSFDIEMFHGEFEEGFLVSDSEQVYYLIGKKGEFLMKCDIRCIANPERP